MSQNDEEVHSPGYENVVKRQTALDMLSDQELIDELVKRRRLLVVTAKRSFPLDMHSRDGFMGAVHSRLSRDVGEYLHENQLLSTEEEYNYRDRRFYYKAVSIVLSMLPEEYPI